MTGAFHQGKDPCDYVGLPDAACRLAHIPVGELYQLNDGPGLSRERDPEFMVGGTHWNDKYRFTSWPAAASQDWFGAIGGITAGPDKAVWFAEKNGNVGRIAMNGGFTEFPVSNVYPGKAPDLVAFAKDIQQGYGDTVLFISLWGADRMANMKIDGATVGPANPFMLASVALGGEAIGGMAAGPDGNIWISETRSLKIWAYPDKEYKVPNGGEPMGIVRGPDNAMWFVDGYAKIGRIATPESTWSDCCGGAKGTIQEFPVPTSTAGIGSIAVGPDGALWFTEVQANKIGTITTAGVIREFGLSSNTCPQGIAGGPDGAVWFTEPCANRIGRIAPDGSISEIPIPNSPGGHPIAITTGPDGNLWFTEAGQLDPQSPKLNPKVERLEIEAR